MFVKVVVRFIHAAFNKTSSSARISIRDWSHITEVWLNPPNDIRAEELVLLKAASIKRTTTLTNTACVLWLIVATSQQLTHSHWTALDRSDNKSH